MGQLTASFENLSASGPMDVTFTASSDTCLVVAVRHGQTDWNAEGRIQGQLNIDLNAVGENQCLEAAKQLKTMGFDRHSFAAVYSSPLNRAHTSAEIISSQLGTEDPIQDLPGLMEWNAGRLQGKLTKNIKVDLPEYFQHWVERSDIDCDFGHGESIRKRAERIQQCIKDIAAQHVGQKVLVVTHAGVLSDLFRLACGRSLKGLLALPKENAGIHIFQVHIPTGTMKCLYWAGHDVDRLINQPQVELKQSGALAEGGGLEIV